jgi:hypothetical protein
LGAQRSPNRTGVEIRLASGTPIEERGREQLERILTGLDLSTWLFTRTVQIQARVIPHSHPILTLNTRYLEDDTAQVATFVHEQLHWFFDRNAVRTDSAIAELRTLYPEAPSEPPLGARDAQSTYLHLLVCLLEYDALNQLFGETITRRKLGSWQHYTWIYRQILDRPEPIREILRKYRLDKPDART